MLMMRSKLMLIHVLLIQFKYSMNSSVVPSAVFSEVSGFSHACNHSWKTMDVFPSNKLEFIDMKISISHIKKHINHHPNRLVQSGVLFSRENAKHFWPFFVHFGQFGLFCRY